MIHSATHRIAGYFRHFRYASHNLGRFEIVSALGEVAILWVVLVVVVNAAGFSASFEPESAALAGGAVSKTKNSASSGRYLVFGNGSTTSPTPTPTPAPVPTPTPAPAPAPTPTPVPAGPVAYGWQLTAANTGLAGAGVSRNSLPVFSGAVTAGMTISQKKITSTLDLSSIPNVTLDRVWLAPVGGIRALITGPGTVIKDSDIDGSSMVAAERMGIYSSGEANYTVSSVAITQVSIGAWLDGYSSTGSTISDTYIYNLISIAGAHVDGLTRRGGTGPLTVARTRIDASGNSVTGAFFLQDTWGDTVGGITLKDTYLEGVGYTMSLDNRGTGVSFRADNVRIRSTGYGPIGTGGSIAYPYWNNVRVYDGNRLPVADGAIINIP